MNAGYIPLINSTEIGFADINCTGNEERLEDCRVYESDITDMPLCLQAGIVRQCINGKLRHTSTKLLCELFQFHRSLSQGLLVAICPLDMWKYQRMRELDSVSLYGDLSMSL